MFKRKLGLQCTIRFSTCFMAPEWQYCSYFTVWVSLHLVWVTLSVFLSGVTGISTAETNQGNQNLSSLSGIAGVGSGATTVECSPREGSWANCADLGCFC
jgi:hypothetical protein